MKKILSCFIIIVLLSNLVLPGFASANEAPIRVHNGIVEYRVNADNGRFTIHTAEGLPNKASDNDKNLLFFWDLPDTSFTTFRMNGEDYIFGNSYGIMGAEGGIVSPPKVDGNITTTVWRIKNIEVTQKLQLIVDESNPNVGNTKITYEVLNKGESSVELGSRILLDTQLGSNDASPMLIGSTYVTNETEYTGAGVPVAWKSADEKFAPGVISYGLLSGWDNVAPDKLVIAHWESLSNTKWDYKPNELINFTTDKNNYGSADSAAAVYFEPKTLKNGAEVVYETFYGIGSLSDTYNDTSFNFQVNTPNKLTVNDQGTGYKEQSFDVVVSIDNNGVGATAITDATVILGLSDELKFAEGQADREYVKHIAVGDTLQVKFKVVPTAVKSLKVAELGATIQYGGKYAEASKFVVLPSIKGAPPKMQMTEISPKIAYTKSQKKTFVIKGSDFDSLKADYQWTLYIKGQNSGISYPIKRKDITITNDTLTVSVDKAYEFKADRYDLILYSDAYGNMSKTVELSNDKKYDRKEYGTLLMGAFSNDDDGKPVYGIKVLEREEDYEKLTEDIKNNTLLTLRGEIYEYEINGEIQYDCGSGTIINSSILYTAPTAEPNKCLTIKRYKEGGVDWWGKVEDSLVMTGKGFLTIGDYTFHYGDLYVVLSDGKNYELAPPTTYVEDKKGVYNPDNPMDQDEKSKVEIITPANVVGGEVLKTVGALTGTKITINNAVIGSNTISLGGSISVALPWMSKAADGEDDDSKDSDLKKTFDKNDGLNSKVGEGKKTDDILGLNLKEMRYGVKEENNSAYLVGLIADGSLKLEDDTIPKFDAGGAHAAFALDSLNYDGMYAKINAGFKVGEAFECDGTVSLVFETGGSCVPDSVELVLGGEALKIPLGAGPANVGYLTKIGGGVYNLYNTIKGYYNVIPPLTLKLISGYADPTLYSFQLGTIGLEFGLNGFKLSAEEGKIVGLKVIEEAYAKFLVYVTEHEGVMYPCVDIGAGIKVNLLGIVKGEGSIWLVADPRINSIFGHVSLGGKAYVGIFIPDYIPLLGGVELAAIMAELSTYRVYCGVRFLGIPISVGYYWADKKVKFNDDFAYLAQELNVPAEEFENALGYEYTETDSNSDGLMVFGGNLRQTYSSKRSDAARLLSYDTSHEIKVLNQKYGLFELQYTGDMPAITVTKPDGSNYALKLNENYRIQTIDSEKSESGITEQKIYITVTDPEDGIWTIKTDKAVDCTAMNVLPLPELKAVSCNQVSNEKLQVNWDAGNVDDSYTVDIHLSEIQKTVDIKDFVDVEEYNGKMAAGYDPGIIVAKDIPVKDKKALVDITERLTSGSYQARVVLKKGGEVYASELSSNTFTYVNPNVPDMPQNIQVSLGGDGQFKVAYDAVKNAKGYVVTVLDEDGNEIKGFEGMITEKTKVYIGNEASVATRMDENGKPTEFEESGVIPGKSYKVKVYAYNEKDYITYKSREYISDAIYLPEPNPATVTLKLDDILATKAGGKDEINTVGATTNKKNANIKYISNQDVKVAYWMDGVTNGTIYEVKAHAPLEIPMTLEEGGSIVEFWTVNAANDYTVSKLCATLDTVKPELLLDSVSVLSTDGQYEIVGTSEPNAKVYVGDDVTMAVPVVNGSFSYHGLQSATRDEIKVTAVDVAGNENTMVVEVIPGELSDFKSIAIKNTQNAEVDEIQIHQGDKAEIKVYGVSQSGKEFELDNSNVTYSVIYGGDKVSVNEKGEIEGKYYGNAVVLCEYKVTEEYSFEQTVTVTVSQAYEEAKDIRISTTDISSPHIGSAVAKLSIPDAPVGVTYDFKVEDNEYFEVVANRLVLKKELNTPTVTISVTAQGKHVLDGVYINIGNPITKEFTFTLVKNIVSVENLASRSVYTGTEFTNLGLPKMINVTLNTGEIVQYPVTWNQGAYNAGVATTYKLNGTIERGENVNNPDDIFAHISVTVRKRPSRGDSADAIPTVNQEGITYKYEGETLVITPKDNGNTAGLSKKILDMEKNLLKIKMGNAEIILDNATCEKLKASGSENINISATQKDNVITIHVGNRKDAKGIVKTKIMETEGASIYNMVVFKEGKIVPNSYYNRDTGEMVFAMDGSGDYTIEKRSYRFGDTEDHWAENAISYVATRGLVSGVGGNSFEPEKNVTRAEFLKMILSAAGIRPEKTEVAAADVSSNDWFAPFVGFAIKNGIVSGYEDGTFKPNNEISREEMMVMLNNCIKFLGVSSERGKIAFTDQNDISHWAVSAVQDVTSLGLITGNSDGSLLPLNNATRAESAIIMMRCVRLLTEHIK